MHMYTLNIKPINPTALLPAHIRPYSSSAYAATGQVCESAMQGVRGIRETCYGCKHLVLPCSTVPSRTGAYDWGHSG